jgi:tetratricopeptide (TPR) repeat protein
VRLRGIDLERWHGWGLFLLFASAGLALGSAQPTGMAVVTALSAVVWVVGRLERGAGHRGQRPDGVAIVLWVLTGFTFLQAVPIPPGWVAFLSPRAFGLHDGAWAALGEPHRHDWFPLSLDPPATVLAGVRMLALTLTYLTVRHRVRAHGARAVLEPLVGAGVAIAAVFFLHRLAGWDRVYDIYAPRYVHHDPVPAPFLNLNHLASALGMFAVLSFGLALSSVDRFRRLTLLAAGALTGGGCVLTLSRGGILAFVTALLLFGTLRLARQLGGRSASMASPTGEERRAAQVGWLSLGMLLALTAGAWVAYDAVVHEFESGDASKLEIAADAWPMTVDHAAVGVGRGAFMAAFPPYNSAGDTATYTHPENLPAQFLSEWGVLFGGLALLGLAFVLGRSVLSPPRRVHGAAAVAALFLLLLQNLVDFGMELLGLALPMAAVLAVISEGRLDRREVRRRGRTSEPAGGRRLPPYSWIAVPVGVAALLGLAWPWAAEHDLEQETDRFRTHARTATPWGMFEEEARGAFARHPADYYLPFLVGVHAARSRTTSPIPFWNQALRLHPRASSVHFAVGSFLAQWPEYRVQAAEELGLAVRAGPSALGPAAARVAQLFPDFAGTAPFVRLASDDPVRVWDALAAAYRRLGIAEAAADADGAVLRSVPGHPPARFRRARAALEAGRPAEALVHVGAADPPDRTLLPDRYLLGGQALDALGRRDEAVGLLAEGVERSDSPALPVMLADLQAARGNTEAALDALALLETRARTQKDRSDAVAGQARFLARHGRVADALIQTRRALGIDPGRLDLWTLAAELAERLDDLPGALWALRELSRRQPRDDAIKERLRAIEARLAEARVRVPGNVP